MNIPHIFSPATKAKSAEVNENFQACKVEIEKNSSSIEDTTKNLEDFKTTIEPQVMPDYNNTLKEKAFIVSNASNKITIKAGTIIRLEISEDDVRYLQIDKDTNYNIYEIMDTGAGSLTAGKDYYVYVVQLDEEDEETQETIKKVDIKVSANSTYPTGYSAYNSRKIGGFHTLCAAVTESNAPALANNSVWVKHPAIGYNAGDIIPNSVWCLTHRPQSEPEGMAYIDKIDMWVDIYLQSGKNGEPTSIFGATVADNRQQILHQWDMQLLNKKLATDNDFTMFAEGSNQKTAIYGSAAPSPKTSGGHLDTAGKRMISGYFIEECCGYLWQWLDQFGANGGSGFASYGTGADDRGNSYGIPYCLSAGGAWNYSSSCGSRSRNANNGRSDVLASCGGRGVSLPLRAA